MTLLVYGQEGCVYIVIYVAVGRGEVHTVPVTVVLYVITFFLPLPLFPLATHTMNVKMLVE